MLNFRRITVLLSCLLISNLVTSCSCENKIKKELKELAAEEQKLTENFKKHFTLQQWDTMRKVLLVDKYTTTPAQLERLIKAWENPIEKLKIIETHNIKQQVDELTNMSKTFSSGFNLPAFSFKDINQAKTFFSDLIAVLKNYKRQADLKKK
jgi:hypothetical protein